MSNMRRITAVTMLLLIAVIVVIPVFADDGGDVFKLPKGYVEPYTFFTRGSTDENPTFYGNYHEVQSSCVTLFDVAPRAFDSIAYQYALWADPKPEPKLEWRCSDESMIWERGKKNKSFTITATERLDANGRATPDRPAMDDSHMHYTVDYRLELTISDIRYGEGEWYDESWLFVTFSGTESATWSVTDNKEGKTENYSAHRTIDPREVRGVLTFGDKENPTIWSFTLDAEDPGTNPFSEYIGWQDIIEFAVQVRGMTPRNGVKIEGYTQYALNSSGEDSGVTVPGAIVLGLLSAGAAVGAAGAASGANIDDDKKKAFKMFVQKDFGDAIRRGGPLVKVRARMAEIDIGAPEKDRPDLTAKIGVTGEHVAIHSAAVVGRYLEATVSAQEDEQADEATITFSFEGEGGIFNNNVIFRLVDGPEIKFLEETAPGSGEYRMLNSGVAVEAIPGDRFTYSNRFIIADATTEVLSLKAEKVDGFDVTFEPTKTPYMYIVHVRNDTPADPKHDIFAPKEDVYINFSATLKDEKYPVEGFVRMEMYPEGLTVQSRDKGKKGDLTYVRVQSYEKDHVGDLDKLWQVSQMTFTLAIKGEDKAIIDPEGMEFTFGKLKGSGGLGMAADKEQTTVDKFQYKEEYGEYNDKFTYEFEPNSRLYEPIDGTFFMTLLPVECTYDNEKYPIEVPLRLRGKDLDPMEVWEKEYEKTRQRIERFSPPSQQAEMLRKLEEIAIQDTCRISTTELRLMCWC